MLDKPEVESHLRRTIEFYIKNGILPTLDQLKSGKVSSRRYSVPSIGLIPGLDAVGCGFDVTTLENRFCLLELRKSSNNARWYDPYNPSFSYSLPEGFFATNTPESLSIVSIK